MMKAQVSVEYIMVVALVMLVLVPATFLFYSYSQRSTEQLTGTQVQRIGNSIVNNAEKAYYMGEPARLTIREQFPDGIVNFTTVSDWSQGINELIITVQGETTDTFVFPSAVNINATLFPRDTAPGLKLIYMEAFQTADGVPFVAVSIGGRCPAANQLIDWADGDCILTGNDLAPASNLCFDEDKTAGTWNGKWNTCMHLDFNGNCTIDPSDGVFLLQHLGETVC